MLEFKFSFDSTNASNTCPVCRKDQFVSFPHYQADREIKEFLIYCPNKSNGCEWIGELNDIKRHVRNGKCCDLKCSKCDETVTSNEMKSHLDTECPCYCPYCNMTAEREVISSEHKENCHKFPLTCTNNCGLDNIPWDNMDEHKKVCPLEMIQCEYFDVGCQKRISRKHQKEHNSDSFYRFYHLQLVYNGRATQAIKIAASFADIRYSWLQLLSIFFVVVIMQAIIIKFAFSSKNMKLFQHIQEDYPTLLWSIILDKSSELSSHGDQVAPVVLKMSNISEIVEHKKSWYSNSFFAIQGGYKMLLGINLVDVADCSQTSLNTSLYLMKGPHDDELEQSGHWPLRGTFTIELLNQQSDSDHFSKEMIFCEMCNTEMSPKDEKMIRQWSYEVLLSHDTILNKKNLEYIRNNSLYFKISYNEANSNYIINYLIRPSVAGVSAILGVGLVVGIFKAFSIADDHDDTYDSLVVILYFTTFGSVIEHDLLRGILWGLFCFIFAGGMHMVLAISLNDVIKLTTSLALGGCLAKMLVEILFFIF